MKIDRKLNLVVAVEIEDGRTIYVHSTPISREVFDRYFIPISKAFAAIYTEGLGPVAGPRVAGKMLKKVAMEMGVWDTPDGVERGLIAEIRRLSNVIMPTNTGWQTIPLEEALKEKMLSDDDADEVENIIGFFISASAMNRRPAVLPILTMVTELWGALLTPFNCTEYQRSLPTSTPDATTGEAAKPLSVPS